MRKAFYRVLLFLAITIISQGDFLFAQDSTDSTNSSRRTDSSGYTESEFYYYNFTIEKIYSHRLGYIVSYRKASNKIVQTYIPIDWFNTIGGKGEIVYLGSGSEWPSMIVYYKNGEFSHVRLRLRKEITHSSWGLIPFTVNIDDLFQDIEELKLEL